MPSTSFVHTKIVCTLGPASSSPEVLRSLMEAGLNVARINFSHGTHEEHAAVIATVRRLAAELERPVAILGDLQGPRIRVGALDEPISLADGADVVLAPEDIARAGEIPITYGALSDDVRVGDRVLMDDGLIELVVAAVERPRVRARVVHGGLLRSHKGMNLPGVAVSAPSITDKDRADIAFAVAQELDYLALSFVRRAEDIASLRALIPKWMLVVAKIEKDTALANIRSIVEASNAVMVARGDLGVELPFEEVPIAQKRIIAVANALGRPVITATQMLESMVTNPRPTRAEASDVANAILDGTDAVMLSAETATGHYPELAVRAMTRISREIEAHPMPRPQRPHGRRENDVPVATEDAIAAATAAAAASLGAPIVMVITKSGFTARIVASYRPAVPIFALTDVERTYRQLALVRGVIPALVAPAATYEEMFEHGRALLRRLGLAQPGDRILVTAGVPFDVPGTTNLLRVEVV
ncbi:MAG: pyruvate kinase [Gemmatimonadaceae bacterium]|nr:pyruvate kinase [Gemmatimonadaceae bacterium]